MRNSGKPWAKIVKNHNKECLVVFLGEYCVLTAKKKHFKEFTTLLVIIWRIYWIKISTLEKTFCALHEWKTLYLLLILSTWRAQLVKTRHLSKNSSNELESSEFLVQTGAKIKQSLYSSKEPQNCSSSYTSWLFVTWLRSQLAVARETAWKSKHAKAFDSPFHLRVLCWWGGGVSTRVIISPYFLFWLIRQLSKQSRVCSGIRPWQGETLCVRLITMHCFASLNISGYSHRSWPTLVSLCFPIFRSSDIREDRCCCLTGCGEWMLWSKWNWQMPESEMAVLAKTILLYN